jgi:hypothetical protein
MAAVANVYRLFSADTPFGREGLLEVTSSECSTGHNLLTMSAAFLLYSARSLVLPVTSSDQTRDKA